MSAMNQSTLDKIDSLNVNRTYNVAVRFDPNAQPVSMKALLEALRTGETLVVQSPVEERRDPLSTTFIKPIVTSLTKGEVNAFDSVTDGDVQEGDDYDE